MDDNIYLDINPEEFLINFTTPERAELLSEAFAVLVSHGYDSITDEFVFITNQVGFLSNEAILDGFCELVSRVQKHALKEHGVYVKLGTPIQIITTILKSFHAIEDYEDPEQLLTSLQLSRELGDQEVFADVMEEVIGEDESDEVASWIASVSPAFINSLENYLNSKMESLRSRDLATEPHLDDETLKALKLKVDACGELSGLQMPDILSGGMPIMLPFAAYVGELAYRHRKEKDAKVIAADLLLAVDVSSDRTGDSLAMISSYATEFSDDVAVIADIVAKARAILGSLPIEPK